MPRSISVFGLGYVGTVTAACLAHQGHSVTGVDINPAKVEAIEAGVSPVIEPGLSQIVEACHHASRLHATMDAAKAVRESDISFLCVGTPSLQNGNLDLGHVEPVCRQIGEALKDKDTFHLVALRSTVLPGTAETVVIPALESASGKQPGKDFGVCVSPEFMREGSAVSDFMEPAITVIGAAESTHFAMLFELFNKLPGRVLEVPLRTAEMIKYLNNAWHATKVAFVNEAGILAKELGVDTETLLHLFAADTKLNISNAYLKPGFAFGGSCLPKDLRALSYRAKQLDLDLPLLNAVMPSNQRHLDRALAMMLETRKKRITVLGLSFKEHTDDLRESPQVQLVKRLLGEGLAVSIWDPNVTIDRLIGTNRQYTEEVLPHLAALMVPDLHQAVAGAEVVVVATRSIEAAVLKRSLRKDHIVIDLVNFEKGRRPDGSSQYNGICW
jgi:GDP-mannose 6-dehydrogenase